MPRVMVSTLTAYNNLYFWFCPWLLHTNADELESLCHVLWTDEAAFTRSGVNRLHNLHEWALENPH
jgi:hypothetical protein